MSVKQKIAEAIEETQPEMADIFRKDAEVKTLSEANRYFRQTLCRATANTRDERGFLSDDLPFDIWLSYFKSHVLPTIVRFNLIH